MAYSGLSQYIEKLEKENEIVKVSASVNTSLEITEITERVSKSNGKALLFTNNGTRFPLLINSYGSVKRMLMAINLKSFDDAGADIEKIFNKITGNQPTLLNKIALLPDLLTMSRIMPSYSGRKGKCQEVIHENPDLGIFPVLKCWPHDGGRFITLPMVHTVHPDTGKTNVGMYRMQILDERSTGMHWQRHKTGANHFEAWKKSGRKMPVTVTLGGDPVYAYAATAPLPENISEYILAGFLRKEKVRLVKCITNDLYVPDDADIVIEGFVDPDEELVWEGPFGDHTGFYSLADWYPRFRVTCITHRRDAVYPATIVGVPPQEDTFIAMATEKIFLAPVKMTLQPEIIDFHLPDAGVAHNLLIVRIDKNYPGQGMKVLSSLFGTGQMMFTKYLIAVSGDVDIRNYSDLAKHIFRNINIRRDLIFNRGPLDVLDHSSDAFSYGGKLGIDATEKMKEEQAGESRQSIKNDAVDSFLDSLFATGLVTALNRSLLNIGIPVVIISVNQKDNNDITGRIVDFLSSDPVSAIIKLFLIVDHTVDVSDPYVVAWQVLGNSDPMRDHNIVNGSSLLIDGTIKLYKKSGFPRKWPNVVCSDESVIKLVDEKWHQYGIGQFIPSPSADLRMLLQNGKDEIVI
jgi:4-hydroxy-3-polyprenylbenzoate decarboxylase